MSNASLTRQDYTLLRNALVTGVIIPNEDGTGALTRLKLYHARAFMSAGQISIALNKGYIHQVDTTPLYDLPVYALTPYGLQTAQLVPMLRDRGTDTCACHKCGCQAVATLDDHGKQSYWCYYCEVYTDAIH